MGIKFKDVSVVAPDRASVDMSAEWGEGVTVYAPPVTAADLGKLMKRHPMFLNQPTPEGIVDLLILKAENAEGEKFFTLEDKVRLMRLPASHIEKAGGCLGKIDMGDDAIEDAEKN